MLFLVLLFLLPNPETPPPASWAQSARPGRLLCVSYMQYRLTGCSLWLRRCWRVTAQLSIDSLTDEHFHVLMGRHELPLTCWTRTADSSCGLSTHVYQNAYIARKYTCTIRMRSHAKSHDNYHLHVYVSWYCVILMHAHSCTQVWQLLDLD